MKRKGRNEIMKTTLFLLFAVGAIFLIILSGSCVKVESATGATICVTFTAPADSLYHGGPVVAAASYEFYYATHPLDSTNWQTATKVIDPVIPLAPGSHELRCTITGLAFSTQYWVLQIGRGQNGLASLPSNVITVITNNMILVNRVTDLAVQ